MATEVHYELYVKQKDRWPLEANYPSSKRDEAIEEAKLLERQGHIQTVKVAREQRNADTGFTRETTVYIGGREKEERRREYKGRRRGDDDGGGRGSDPHDDDGPDDGPRRRASDEDPYDVHANAAGGGGGSSWADMEVEIKPRDWGEMLVGGDDHLSVLVQRNQTATPGRRAAGGTAAPLGPEAVVLTKVLAIVVASILFAAAVTWIFQRGFA